MEKERLESLLIDYIDGKLTDDERAMIDRELMANEETYKLYEQLKEVITGMKSFPQTEPSPRIKAQFAELLKEESSTRGGRVIVVPRMLHRIAAAVLLVVLGGGIGFWVSKRQDRDRELLAMRKEMDATKQLLMTMLENQQSASQRFQGATVALNEVDRVDDEIADALIHAMNTDENTNVQIAALEALGKFYDQPHIRKALIASLKTQKDPLVQIALIRILVQMKEKSVIKDLERISSDEESLPAVKDEAHAGILKLS